VNKKENKDLTPEQKAKNWWRWFWATIIFLLIVYIGAVYLGAYGSKNYDINTTQGRKNYSKKMIGILKEFSPELAQYISNLSEESKADIREKIHQEVAAAYEPVYKVGIKNFADFHYSVIGEYTELYYKGEDNAKELLTDKKYNNFEKMIYEKLFVSSDFDSSLKKAYVNIHTFALSEIASTVENLHTKVKNDLNISNEQATFLVEEMLRISTDDMEERFKNEVSIGMHASGLGAGAVVGAIASKQIAKVFTKKIATKAAIKGGSKLAGAGAGAAIGASEGLLCGPGAILCTPVGAVVGGVFGWFATDAAVMVGDEYFSRKEFEDDLNTTIKQQQDKMEQQLVEIYTNSIDKINKENQEKLEKFKHTQNKEHF